MRVVCPVSQLAECQYKLRSPDPQRFTLVVDAPLRCALFVTCAAVQTPSLAALLHHLRQLKQADVRSDSVVSQSHRPQNRNGDEDNGSDKDGDSDDGRDHHRPVTHRQHAVSSKHRDRENDAMLANRAQSLSSSSTSTKRKAQVADDDHQTQPKRPSLGLHAMIRAGEEQKVQRSTSTTGQRSREAAADDTTADVESAERGDSHPATTAPKRSRMCSALDEIRQLRAARLSAEHTSASSSCTTAMGQLNVTSDADSLTNPSTSCAPSSDSKIQWPISSKHSASVRTVGTELDYNDNACAGYPVESFTSAATASPMPSPRTGSASSTMNISSASVAGSAGAGLHARSRTKKVVSSIAELIKADEWPPEQKQVLQLIASGENGNIHSFVLT